MWYESMHKDCLNEKDANTLRFHLGCALQENTKIIKIVHQLNAKVRRLEKLLNDKNKAPYQIAAFEDDLKKEEQVESCPQNQELLQILLKKVFGKSSEKHPSKETAARPRLKNDKVSLHADRLCPAPKVLEGKKLKEEHKHYTYSDKELGDIAVQYGYPRDSKWEKMKIEDKSKEIDAIVATRRYLCWWCTSI